MALDTLDLEKGLRKKLSRFRLGKANDDQIFVLQTPDDVPTSRQSKKN